MTYTEIGRVVEKDGRYVMYHFDRLLWSDDIRDAIIYNKEFPNPTDITYESNPIYKELMTAKFVPIKVVTKYELLTNKL